MPRNENAYLSRAWLSLLPLPLDQALRAPLQKYKSRVISRKWGNVIKTVKIVERGRKIDEEKKTGKTRERKGRALAPLSPRSSPLFFRVTCPLLSERLEQATSLIPYYITLLTTCGLGLVRSTEVY